MTTFGASISGYLLTSLVYTSPQKRELFLSLFFAMAGSTLLYLILEGYIGFTYPCKRKRSLTGNPALKILDYSSIDDARPKNESLFEQGDLDIQKEQYVNCDIFYGKFFTGDCFKPTTPFVY